MKDYLKLTLFTALAASIALGCMGKATQPETQAPDAKVAEGMAEGVAQRKRAEESAKLDSAEAERDAVSDEAPEEREQAMPAQPAAPAPKPMAAPQAAKPVPMSKRRAAQGPKDSKSRAKQKAAVGLGSVGTLGHGAGQGFGTGHGILGQGALGRGGLVVRPGAQQFNTESYDSIEENRFLSAQSSPKSTFSIDVDTASYSNMRRFLTTGSLPPPGAVRTEELINYFSYNYPDPTGKRPFSVNTEVSPAPWNPQHQLVQIGIQGKRLATRDLPPRNLVFLLDVSGSMGSPNKLPLLKRSLSALVDTLTAKDRVAIVVYAGASGLVLPSTQGSNKPAILDALGRLESGGSTNGGAGIQLAYRVARQNASKHGINRVILATDGDFNVGTTNRSELIKLIETERKSGVFLTVLGFGMGNYKDDTLEQLADKGNGNYAYIDTFREAQKVLVEEAGATLVTLAKDVKIQVEFNPKWVGAYRLIGYENRKLNNEDFKDDTKDAGEIGAGHTVTALYELVPPQLASKLVGSDKLKYQNVSPRAASDGELLTVSLRYKHPKANTSQQLDYPVSASQWKKACQDRSTCVSAGSENFRFAAALAAFGMILHDSEYRGNASYALVKRLASNALGADQYGHRKEFLTLVERASSLDHRHQ